MNCASINSGIIETSTHKELHRNNVAKLGNIEHELKSLLSSEDSDSEDSTHLESSSNASTCPTNTILKCSSCSKGIPSYPEVKSTGELKVVQYSS